jgi:DNA primase
MSRELFDEIKRQIPLLDYLQAQDWQPARQLSRGRWMGVCPLHSDHKPSFLVDSVKSLFYCYGCGRGGDVIRFAELYHQIRFPQALALLQQWRGLPPLLPAAAGFYQMQLHRHAEAVAYLLQRGLHQTEVIEELHIGYAPGRCLRAWLISLGYPLESLQQAGLVNAEGHDTYSHRIVFPLDGNLYGRSTGAATPHRFLPGSKGGLYGWEKVRKSSEIILVEGMFDLAVLWQAGFRNVTCALGTHLNALQFHQLCTDDRSSRTVYLALDSDPNGSGHKAAHCLSHRLRAEGITTRRVELPDGHDPNSFFAGGGNAHEFQRLLERACL